MPVEEEVALARSAGLDSWTHEATVYVLERGGYRVAQAGTNGFACLVGRDVPGSSWPVCYDPEGVRTIVPVILRHAELRERGVTRDEIEREDGERFASGEYRAPARPGLAYMLSSQNRVFDGTQVSWFPPHLMFYAPYVQASDVGADETRLPRSPLMLFEGNPHGYFVVVVPDEMPKQPSAAAGHPH